MTHADDLKDVTARQVVRLFADIHATLPAGCAQLVSGPTRDNFGLHVAISPSNELSAEVGATLMGGGIYSADFGKAPTFTTFEFPWEVGLSRKAGLNEQLEALEKICLAVIAGNCEHRRGRLGTLGAVFVSETQTFRVTDYPLLAIFLWRHDLRVRRYAPYYEGAATHSRSFPRLSL